MRRRRGGVVVAVMLMLIMNMTAVYAEDDEDIEETTTETETTTNENSSTTIDETKQIVEEISAKVDKVDNQISQQMVDAAKIENQAKDIEDLKTQVAEVKATLAEIPEVDTNRNSWGNPYEPGYTLPIDTTKRYYIYELRFKTIGTQTNWNVYYIASNSPNLQIIYTTGTQNNATSSYLGVTNLYTEQNGQYIQPIVGVNANTGSLQQIKEMITNPDNWGYWKADQTDTANYKWYAGYYQRNGQTRMTQMMIVPSGYTTDPNADYAGVYMATGLGIASNADLTIGVGSNTIQINENAKEMNTLEIIETVKPPEQPWTVEQIYTPVLVIMSVLVIGLFKKH